MQSIQQPNDQNLFFQNKVNSPGKRVRPGLRSAWCGCSASQRAPFCLLFGERVARGMKEGDFEKRRRYLGSSNKRKEGEKSWALSLRLGELSLKLRMRRG